jgi:hypothetical protein
MNPRWTEQDKKIVRTAFVRAQKRADEEALKLFHESRVQTVEQLWEMELKIRQWRKERVCVSVFSYEFAGRKIQELLKQGWLLMSDLQSLSEERRAIVLGTAKGAGRATQE